MAQIRPAIVSFILLTFLTGVVYPAIVTGIAKLAFPDQAGGSIVTVNGKAIGSELIAQPFTDARYFWPRPSAAKYDGTAGSGSNLAPSNPALADAIKQRTAALRAADPGNDQAIPIDLLTASASGLDPHISFAAAQYQSGRVARARHKTVAEVQRLIEQNTEPRTLGALGEARVNVLMLNLALDANDGGATTQPG
jgi:K+-transporting ATPase ATPase C chain